MTASEPCASRFLGLPLELRDKTYEHSIDWDAKVYVYVKCTAHSNASLVCQQLRAEVKTVIARTKRPCKHAIFHFTLWDLRESFGDVRKRFFDKADGMRGARDHDISLANTRQIRVITVNIGNDNPLAVTLSFETKNNCDAYGMPLNWPVLTIYGASERREQEL